MVSHPINGVENGPTGTQSYLQQIHVGRGLSEGKGSNQNSKEDLVQEETLTVSGTAKWKGREREREGESDEDDDFLS